jgi:hypothetical protein
MVVGNASGALLCVLAVLLEKHVKLDAGSNQFAMIAYPTLASIPCMIGFVASYVWKPLQLTVGRTALYSLYCVLLAVAGAFIAFHEGAVCLIIVSPLLYVFVFLGASMGRIWFRVDRNKLNLCMFPPLVLVAVGEPVIRVDQTAVETDEILIHAAPQKVWPHVTSFPKITDEPRFWLFRVGLPMPMATTSKGDFVGADRRCIFNHGAVFREKVAEIVPNEKLTFDIVEPPSDPELIGHLTAERGQFELRDNHDGTTTLIGRTWYALHVRPLWYFDWWTQTIFRAVHLRVMENVREMSEKGA